MINIIAELGPQKVSPLSVIELYRLDGAYSAVGELDTAFAGGRTPRYAAFLIGLCTEPEALAADRAWVRSLWEALRPHMRDQGYINAIDAQDDQRIQGAYGLKFDRLAGLKAKYDPDNIFHRNVNIKPRRLSPRLPKA